MTRPEPSPTPTGTSAAPAPARRTSRATRPYLTPVPDSLPPFDDERPAAARLRMLTPVAKPAVALVRRPTGSDPVAIPAKHDGSGVPRAGHPTATAVAASRASGAPVPGPPVGEVAGSLARILAEVLAGQRPAAQLGALCDPAVLEDIRSQVGSRPGMSRVRAVRVCEPALGVAEVSVAFAVGQRVRALAFRLEHRGRWLITAADAG